MKAIAGIRDILNGIKSFIAIQAHRSQRKERIR
jgi:hypothetical protein